MTSSFFDVVKYGQTAIIATGLVLGLLAVLTYRRSTRGRKYRND